MGGPDQAAHVDAPPCRVGEEGGHLAPAIPRQTLVGVPAPVDEEEKASRAHPRDALHEGREVRRAVDEWRDEIALRPRASVSMASVQARRRIAALAWGEVPVSGIHALRLPTGRPTAGLPHRAIAVPPRTSPRLVGCR